MGKNFRIERDLDLDFNGGLLDSGSYLTAKEAQFKRDYVDSRMDDFAAKNPLVTGLSLPGALPVDGVRLFLDESYEKGQAKMHSEFAYACSSERLDAEANVRRKRDLEAGQLVRLQESQGNQLVLTNEELLDLIQRISKESSKGKK